MGHSLINRLLHLIPPYQPTMVVLTAVLYLTLLPRPLGEEEIFLFDGADKVVHFIMFGGLTGSFIFDRYRIERKLSLRSALLTALISSLLGAVIEYMQCAMQMGRSGNDIYDIMANTLGSFAAVPVCVWLHWINVIIDRRT